MTDPKRVTVLKGDITKSDFGLSLCHLNTLRNEVHIIVHSASSISLVHSLERITQDIISPTEGLANLALQLANLERFVYVSTAYTNTHLYHETPTDVRVDEKIYQLSTTPDVHLEWRKVQETGSSFEYLSNNFSWAYAYAKNLSERLLCDIFSRNKIFNKLLILRPPIIGSAQKFPYTGFSFPLSSPMTIFTAVTALSPSFTARVSTHFKKPETEATNDEVPVDVVVDRLLAHLAFGTSGPVHAVSGSLARRDLQAVWSDTCQFRRWPWVPRLAWLADNWHSERQHFIARQYVILGTSFLFCDRKTIALRDSSSDDDLHELELFTLPNPSPADRSLKQHQIWYCMDRFGRRSLLARIVTRILYQSYKLKDFKEILEENSFDKNEEKS
ncbi:hypothetical protein N7495_009739 [Penicillium taxi]|uniref:uncharacterized protein n=1 Tax=Penicillium taxi TaxID=168475 RepID=UPI0025450889|nr:uncharacterized protein N7495_009739 [Penicillium taxi]KAJ5885229.1 hypothetical protein N7495_009739 [Penicillium taxi]